MAFGSFDALCAQSPLPLCYVLGPPSSLTSTHNPLLLPECAARSIELANTIIFQAATDFAHIAALAMTAIMIFHVRSKFTAVGRKEILTVFYLYLVLTAVSLVLDAGVLPATTDGAFLYFVAAQNGLTSALCTALLVNGFVGFQLYEDGTLLSIWLLRLSSVFMFAIGFVVSLLTFQGWAGLSPQNTTGLFVVLYLINAICVFVYLVMQVILVVNTLQDRWPLWDLAAAVFFFVIGQVILYTFGARICQAVNHYLDGLFFATVCNLLAVMMIYKVCNTHPHIFFGSKANHRHSTGIPSPKKISNFPLALAKTIGTLIPTSHCRRNPSSAQDLLIRISCTTTTAPLSSPPTETPSTPTAPTSIAHQQAARTMPETKAVHTSALSTLASRSASAVTTRSARARRALEMQAKHTGTTGASELHGGRATAATRLRCTTTEAVTDFGGANGADVIEHGRQEHLKKHYHVHSADQSWLQN